MAAGIGYFIRTVRVLIAGRIPGGDNGVTFIRESDKMVRTGAIVLGFVASRKIIVLQTLLIYLARFPQRNGLLDTLFAFPVWLESLLADAQL